MCDFGLSEGAAIAVWTTAASVAASTAAAAAQAKAQADQAAAQKTADNIQTASAIQAKQDQDTQAQQRMTVANDAASQKLQANKLAENAGIATAMTSAGESGVSGNSVSALANEYAEKSDQYTSDVEYNRAAQANELDWSMKGFNSEEDSRINSLKEPDYPNLVASGLQVGGQAISAYSTLNYQNRQLAKGGGVQ